jgi:hypothetical protein
MNGDRSAVIENKNLFRLFAALLVLVALVPMALAGATMDCANPKLPPVRVKWACTVVIKANPKAAFAYVARADAIQADAKLGGMSANFYALLADYSKAIERDPSLVSAYLGARTSILIVALSSSGLQARKHRCSTCLFWEILLVQLSLIPGIQRP